MCQLYYWNTFVPQTKWFRVGPRDRFAISMGDDQAIRFMRVLDLPWNTVISYLFYRRTIPLDVAVRIADELAWSDDRRWWQILHEASTGMWHDGTPSHQNWRGLVRAMSKWPPPTGAIAEDDAASSPGKP